MKQAKILLRQKILQVLKELPQNRYKSASYMANLTLVRDMQNSPGLTLSYMAFSNELNIDGFNRIMALRQRLVLPRVNLKTNQLDLHQVNDLDQLKPVPPFGIREPDPLVHPLVEFKHIANFVIPGLSFTKNGQRLGRGAGYYDKLLTQRTDTTNLRGVCLKEQVTEEIPTEPHDIKMNNVLIF